MTTKSASARQFADFDLHKVDSPAFVIDEIALADNLRILRDIGDRSGAKILLALKAFSMWSMASVINRYLDGVCASGLYEACLGKAHYKGIISVYSPAYKPDDLAKLCQFCDHIIVNSTAQLDRYGRQIRQAGKDIGLRINPHLSLAETARYDPSAPHSRLGLSIDKIEPSILEKIDGLHIHNLCEQGLSALRETLAVIIPLLEQIKGKIKWLNLGGGHMITALDYDRDGLVSLIQDLRETYQLEIILEPGTAIGFDAAILVGEVLDIIDNDGTIAITDISATCHMPDVLEAPYRPSLLAEAKTGKIVSLGGNSCLAGDMIGSYRFKTLPKIGDRLAFLDQAHYSMVKTTMFNGVKHPSFYLWNSQTNQLELIKKFDYTDFERRLS